MVAEVEDAGVGRGPEAEGPVVLDQAVVPPRVLLRLQLEQAPEAVPVVPLPLPPQRREELEEEQAAQTRA